MGRFLRGWAAAAVTMAVLSTGAAQAGQTIKYASSSYMSAVGAIKIHNPYSGNTESAWVGPINATLNPASQSPETFRTYCVDLKRDVTVPSGPYNVDSSAMSGPGSLFEGTGNGVTRMDGARAAWLYATYNPAVTSATQGIALQLAIWSAIYNGQVTTGDYGLKQGDSSGQQFWVVGRNSSKISSTAFNAAYDLAKQYLQASLGKTASGEFWYKKDYPGNIQWQMGGPGGSFEPFSAVPEPSTLALGGIAGLIFVGSALRRRGARA